MNLHVCLLREHEHAYPTKFISLNKIRHPSHITFTPKQLVILKVVSYIIKWLNCLIIRLHV